MEEELRHREVDIPGGVTLFLGNHQPSITAVLRAVKRAEHGILNCIASIVHDYEFVSDVATAFSPFPLLPNLRCGLWYAAAPATTDSCYFKSTDGHSGEWSFSTARLNLHIAQIAAQHGGVCIVDATRRGKTFPDALTKTIPIWATVLNRAVARLIEKSEAKPTPPLLENITPATTASPQVVSTFTDEQLALRLPHWISKNEKNQIEQRLDTWVDEFLALGVDLTLLQSTLKRPLCCLWVSQEADGAQFFENEQEEDWLEVAVNEEIKSKYTWLVLISASIPNRRQRRRLIIDPPDSPCTSPHASSTSSSESGGNGYSSSESEDDRQVDTTLESGTEHVNACKTSVAYETSNMNTKINTNTSGNLVLKFKKPIDLMYDYIPGAGDDEESWAQGLTPGLMWDNIEELLHASAEDIGGIVKQLVKSNSMNERAQKRTGAGARAVGQQSSTKNSTGESTHDWKVQWIAECVGIGLSTNRPAEILKKVGKESTGEEAEAREIAILNVGSSSSSSSIAGFLEETLRLDKKNELNEQGDVNSGNKYLHIPIAGDKNLKRAVLYAVPAAVKFASKHLYSSSLGKGNNNNNRILVVAEPEAIDIAASIVVAILIACFTINENENQRQLLWSRPAEMYPGSTTQLIPAISTVTSADPTDLDISSDSYVKTHSNAKNEENEEVVDLHVDNNNGNSNGDENLFTRTTVRQYLSLVSAYYPQIVLSKSLLKQIYNAFLPESMVKPTSPSMKR